MKMQNSVSIQAFKSLDRYRSDIRSKIALLSPVLLIALAILAAVGALSYSRGFWLGMQGWGVFNWYVDYGSGFIKRGLIGTITSPFLSGHTPAFVETFVSTQHLVLCSLLGIGLIWMASRTLIVDVRSAFLVWLCFATSQFLPTLAYNSGYLDIHLFILLFLATIMWKNGKFLALGIIGLVGPLLHEMFVFLWMQILVLSLTRARHGLKPFEIIAVLAPFASVLLVISFHSQNAVALELAEVPVDAEMRAVLFRQQFGQTTVAAIAQMIKMFREDAVNVISATSYFLLPTFAIFVLSWQRWRASGPDWPWRFVALTLATLSPVLVLLVAWDLSRFLVMTTFCGVLAFWALDKGNKT